MENEQCQINPTKPDGSRELELCPSAGELQKKPLKAIQAKQLTFSRPRPPELLHADIAIPFWFYGRILPGNAQIFAY